MTELAIHQGSTLALTADQDYWNDKQLAALRHMGVEHAGEGDLAVFHHVCTRTGLDPFAKQIYMIGRQSSENINGDWVKVTKYTIQTGIDGFRLIARRASDRLNETLEYEDTLWCGRDGQWLDVWVNPNTPPMAAKVTVLRHGKRFPAVATYSEYVQTVKSGDPNSMWARMPANQLAKCAEALALRKAFPQDLSGIYADEEMGQADRPPRADREGGLAAALNVEQVPNEPDPEPIGEEAEGITSQQLKKMGASMRDLGLTERAQAIAFVIDVIGRDVTSRNDLTKDEASQVIDALEADRPTEPVPQSDPVLPEDNFADEPKP